MAFQNQFAHGDKEEYFHPSDLVHTQRLCVPKRSYSEESDSMFSASFTQLKASLPLR